MTSLNIRKYLVIVFVEQLLIVITIMLCSLKVQYARI